MSRPLRLEFPGAVWHVTTRGNERRDIFRDDEDRLLFLRLLARSSARHRWLVHGFVLMTNHVHLLVETPEPNLSRGMHEINGTYAQKFNRRHTRVGHLLQGRFGGILVSKESHLLELTRYLVLNPVRAGLVDAPEKWPWSNYRATARLVPRPPWLEVAWTLRQFGATDAESVARYMDFVEAGRRTNKRPFDSLKGRIFLGDDDFGERVRDKLARVRVSPEIPRRQKEISDIGIDIVIQAAASAMGTVPHSIRGGRGGEARLLVAALARSHTASSLRVIGEALSIHASRVSRLAAEGCHRIETDVAFRQFASRAIAQLLEVAAAKRQKARPDPSPSR